MSDSPFLLHASRALDGGRWRQKPCASAQLCNKYAVIGAGRKAIDVSQPSTDITFPIWVTGGKKRRPYARIEPRVRRARNKRYRVFCSKPDATESRYLLSGATRKPTNPPSLMPSPSALLRQGDSEVFNGLTLDCLVAIQ